MQAALIERMWWMRSVMVGAGHSSPTQALAPERPGKAAGAVTPITRAPASAAPREQASMVPA